MHAAGQAALAAIAGLLARGLAGGGTPKGWPVAMDGARSTDLALGFACLGVLAASIKLAGGAVASWAEARVAGDLAARVRLSVLDDVLALHEVHRPRHADHGSSQTATVGTHADRLTALTSHVAEIERGVAHGVLAEVRAVVQLVPLAALLVVLAPKLAGSAVVALVAFGVLAFALRRAFKQAHSRAARTASSLVQTADEAVKHAELWATYGARRRIRAHVEHVGGTIARENARLRLRSSLLSSTSEVLGAVALVLALLLASRGALGVEQTAIAPFAIAFFMTYRPLRELVEARLARARGETALRAALGTGPRAERAEVVPASSAPWGLEPLALTGVRTRHGEHEPLSAIVPAGAIAAIVGPTGVGKTSLLRSLLGLDPLASGEVRYGDHVLGGRGVGPRERPFAWVPQDAPVVADSLAVNVALGQADADTGVVDPAPMLAQLGNADLAVDLGTEPLGTVRTISGGERQWIAVARALATGLPVLLLDEPTSALDPDAQERLLAALARLRGQRTILLVTHRPEPIAIADVVVRLEPERAIRSADGAAALHAP